MKIATKFYGEIECDPKEIICFPLGIPGFEDEHQFILLRSERSIFSWMQSVTTKDIAFVVISPSTVCPDYSFELEETICTEMKLSKPEDAFILAIVTIPPGRVEEATVNLQAPVVINTAAGIGRQVILTDHQYPLRHPLWDRAKIAVNND